MVKLFELNLSKHLSKFSIKAKSNLKSNFTTLINATPSQSVESVVAMGVYAADRLEWVKESVASVIEQTYKDYIYIIALDGEIQPDVYDYLIQSANLSNKIVLLRSDKNIGLSSCMNYAIDWVLLNIPSVEYFFRMDADDISLPERFKKQIKYLKKHPQKSVLGTSLIEISENGNKVGKRKLPKKHGDIFRILPKRCAINHPTVVVRMDIFKAGHRYQEDLQNTQDYFLWIELCAAGFKFANLPEPLLMFRRVNDFYKRRGLSKSINEFKARFYAMKVLKRYSIGNIVYAFAVLFLRLMPSKIVKLAYKIDRYLLNKRVRHE